MQLANCNNYNGYNKITEEKAKKFSRIWRFTRPFIKLAFNLSKIIGKLLLLFLEFSIFIPLFSQHAKTYLKFTGGRFRPRFWRLGRTFMIMT